MTETLYELEGTWDELAEHAPELQGKRLRLIVVPQQITDEARPPAKSLEDELDDIAAGIPEEDWKGIPTDLTDHLDHYLYGTPKR